ncbi:MAG TPA: peptidoglycan-binding protein [Mycobacteriales bacterium]|jgi:hypothetical protein|nr:peptidoglycan-binding protein [Mycobacteriales bacterium]
MYRWLRAAAVTGCTALWCTAAGLTASPALADDAPAAAPSFTLAPAFGQVGETVTLTAQGATTFPTDGTATVTFNDDVAATAVTPVSTSELSVVVPTGASTGPVSVVAETTTYDGPTFTLQQPVAMVATLTPSVLSYGGKAVVSATLQTTGALTLPIAGQSATLERRANASDTWQQAADTDVKSTASDGRVSWTLHPASNADYRVHFAETPQYAEATSEPLSVSVKPRITVRPVTTAPVGEVTKITGTVHPHVSGRVVLEKLRHGSWHRADRTQVHHGRFSFGIDPSNYNLLHYRVTRPTDGRHHLASSRVLRIQAVHQLLVYGNRGADVSALQKRLRTLHYDVGPKSSFYGWDMVHAVTAFQKAQGFFRTGRADRKVWKHLAAPKRPQLRHRHVRGTSVEVDLTRQILMIGRNGHVWRILDTSTAGGYVYTDSAGEQATAITPIGHFVIQYKIDHLVKDRLGTLWRPSYFDTSGDAIHGEGNSNAGYDVPAHPASHGCVRITNLAVDRYYNTFAVGVPVWIYH